MEMSYPPGVSDRDIDEHFGSHWPCQECDKGEDDCICIDDTTKKQMMTEVQTLVDQLLIKNTRFGPEVRKEFSHEMADAFWDTYGEMYQLAKENNV